MDSDLFDKAASIRSPLPNRIRPAGWDGYVGQQKLTNLLRSRPVHSMVLYGPPGCGKTTLARILADHSGFAVYALSAVSSGVKEVREVIAKGRESLRVGRPVILIIDEIHRFSKSQQDALLEAVESGWVILIGMTTENPSFEVIGPLLSRCQVYRLEALGNEQLLQLLERAKIEDEFFSRVEFAEDALNLLLEASGGDARKMLGIAELAARSVSLRTTDDSQNSNRTNETGETEANRNESENIPVTKKDILDVLQERVRQYDKAGDNHYDFISAFIKSLRGSDPDAALLYMAVMIEAGEDPLFIARRMIIFASEDVGNAYPGALEAAVSCFQAIERIGMPEGRIVLGQTATFLASLPKSNAAYLAMDAALAAVRGKKITIPNHLRNAPTKTHKAEGASLGYQYPHDFPNHFAGQNYMPEGFTNYKFYHPTEQGHEERLRERLKHLWPEKWKEES